MIDWQKTDEWTLFLDRDGVLNERLPGDYVKRWDEWRWIDGVIDSLKELRSRFQFVFIITNQQGIGKGLMSEIDLAKLHAEVMRDLDRSGVGIDGIYFAPYLASENHSWRKPGTGMLEQVRTDHPTVIPSKSIFIGDSKTDLEAGKAFGSKTVGISDDPSKFDANITDFCTPNLPAFTSYIQNA
jgi:histidinol-phosphate phosphatase family protein